MFRIPRALLAWLLMMSIIAAALLPPIAHAYMHKHGLEEACEHVDTSDGASALSEEATSDESDAKHNYCSFCMKHHVSGYPAMVSNPQIRDDMPTAFFPPLYFSAHSTLFAWLIPSSRAPPTLS